MKKRSRSLVILTIVFGYILLQFMWWEVLLVRQTGQIINEKQKLSALEIADNQRLQIEITALQSKKTTQTIMIVGEGTVFLLLLLFGMYKIKQAMDKETELAAQQKNFFLSITHELKTPIAATKLQLQTLQRSGLDEETKTQLIKSALLENERLNKLINNVLFASRFESEQFVIKPEKLELAQFVESVLQRYFSKELAEKTLTIIEHSTIEVQIDSLSFQSVITNLIENAFKYSAVSSQVALRIFDEAGMAVIEVADTGMGIKDEDKEKVFEKFYRVGDEETRSSKGSGLGLYIVKFLVEQHRGKINLRNNVPKGSIFEIRIPLA